MGTDRVDEYLASSAGDLPTIPQIASQAIQLLEDPDSSVADLRELIEQDAALAARILKVSNSSVYSFAQEVLSLDQALALLGRRTVSNLVMAVALRQTYDDFGPMERMLWEHSAAAGPVAAGLAERVGRGIDRDEAFTAGLLHDIGKAALANSHKGEYEAVMERVHAENIRFADAEMDVFGFDHAELGARVAKEWGLPERVATVIRYHHDREAFGHLDAAVADLTAIVSISTACLSRLGSGRPHAIDELDLTAMEAWKHLGLGDDDVATVLELCSERIEAAKSITG